MWLKSKRLIPPLRIEDEMPVEFEGINTKQASDMANDIAWIIARSNANLRTTMCAVSHVLGWVAFTVTSQSSGVGAEDLMNSAAQQASNYYRAFVAQQSTR
jgi:hypothetical protein